MDEDFANIAGNTTFEYLIRKIYGSEQTIIFAIVAALDSVFSDKGDNTE